MKKNNKIKDIEEYKKSNKNNYKNRRSKKKKNKLLIFFTSITVIAVVLINLYGYSEISKLKYDIHYLQKDLHKKEIILEELKSKGYANSSIQNIEQKAKEQLNMDYPKEENIEYIEVDS